MRLTTAPLVFALVLLAARPARAEGLVVPFIGFSFGGDAANCLSLTNCDEPRLDWGVSLASVHGIFGFEADLGYAPQFFGKAPGADNGVLTLMSNLLVLIPAGPVRPFALVGIGLVRPHAQLNGSALSVDSNTIGYDVGGGVDVLAGRHLGVRGDVRHIRTLQDVSLGVFSGAQLELWRGSVGLVVRF